MSEIIIKRAVVFALILGAFLGLLSVIPPVIGFSLFILSFFSSIIIMLFMKKNDKYLGILTNQEGAVLGAIIGFFSSVGFFISFCPMVIFMKLIIKDYYTYGIPYILQDAIWLFFIIVFMVSAMVSMLNSVCAMGMTFVLNKFETKPNDINTNLDIKIND